MALPGIWASSVLETLHAYQRQKKLCDYKLSSSDGHQIPVHECVLLATCPKFNAVVSGPSAKKKVNTLNCSKQVLASLVNLLYTGKLKSTKKETKDVLSLTKSLGIRLENIEVLQEDGKEDKRKKAKPPPEVADSTSKSSKIKTPWVQTPTRSKTVVSESESSLDSPLRRSSRKTRGQNPRLDFDTGATDRLMTVIKQEIFDDDYDDAVSQDDSGFRQPTPAEDSSQTVLKETKKKPTKDSIKKDSPKKATSDSSSKDAGNTASKVAGSFPNVQSGASHEPAPEDLLRKASEKSPKKPTVQVSFPCLYCSEVFALPGLRTRHEKVHALEKAELEKKTTPVKNEKTDVTLAVADSDPLLENESEASENSQEAESLIEDANQEPMTGGATGPAIKKSTPQRRHLCPTCGQGLGSAESLRKHLAVVHGQARPFACSFCQKRFTQKCHLNEHTRIHTGETPFQCSECGRVFTFRKAWKVHMRTHEPDFGKETKCFACDRVFKSDKIRRRHEQIHSRTFQCNECGKRLSTAASLRAHHQYIHQNLRPFKCSMCDKSFKQKAHLVDHEASHGVKKPFVCSVCEKGFVALRFLQVHEKKCKTLTEAELLEQRTCSQCNKVFKNLNSMKRHVFKKHVHSAGFLCSDCGKTLSTMDCLRKHKEVVHQGLRGFECTICGKKFSQKSHLTEHTRIHTGDRPYVCKICNKSFSHLKNMKMHELVHTGVRNFPCDVCNRAFKQKSALKTHQKIHTKERPFACQYCGKTFPLKQSKESHERLHTGERPYQCQHCSKTFARQSTARVHERIHTGLRPYKCPQSECEAAFAFHHKLRRHLRAVHGIVPQKKTYSVLGGKENQQIIIPPEEPNIVVIQQDQLDELDQKVIFQEASGETVEISMSLDPSQATEVVEIPQEQLQAEMGMIHVKEEATDEIDSDQTYYVIYEVPVGSEEITIDSESALTDANIVLQ